MCVGFSTQLMLKLCLHMYSDSGERARHVMTGKGTSESNVSTKAGSSADTSQAADQGKSSISSSIRGAHQPPQESTLTGSILGAPVPFSLQKH